MADGTIGSAAVVGIDKIGAGAVNSYITITAGTGATMDGLLYKFDAYVEGNDTLKVKVFRDDGTNYNYIGGETFALSTGLNSNVAFTTPIEVLTGDYIGFNTSAGVRIVSSALGIVYKAGNITTNSAKATWSALNFKASILGYIRQPSGSGFFLFLSEAYKRHKDLWTPKLVLPKDLGFSY